MAADRVVAFTTDSKQLADAMAAEVTDTGFHCCAHIEGPVRSVHRWHGRKVSHEEWRVEVEAPADEADAVVEHIRSHHADDVNDLVVTERVTQLSPVAD
jgi:uncharacterized protein involved in tolerance to divalent cations